MSRLVLLVAILRVPSRSLISGHWKKDQTTAKGDFRAHLPRLTGEALGALDVHHSAEDLQRIDAALPRDRVVGERYLKPLVVHPDCERT